MGCGHVRLGPVHAWSVAGIVKFEMSALSVLNECLHLWVPDRTMEPSCVDIFRSRSYSLSNQLEYTAPEILLTLTLTQPACQLIQICHASGLAYYRVT